MIKSEILNNLINQAFENKHSKSSQATALSKAISSKTKLRHLMAANPLTKHPEAKGTSNHSISHQKSSLDNHLREHHSAKSHQLTESSLQERVLDSSKINTTNKGHQPKVGSFFKDRASKPKTLQINTNYTICAGQDMLNDFKTSSAKNGITSGTNMSAAQQNSNNVLLGKENKFNLADLKQLYPQSVKNANSKTFEYLNNRSSNPISCSNKTAAQSPHHHPPSASNHKSVSIQSNPVVKILSPQRAKPKQERAGVNELLPNSTKLFDKRRNSYRYRRSGQLYEIHDDLISKMSTKTPSQFSEIRSFPSHKSRSMAKHDSPENAENIFKEGAQDLKSCQNRNSEAKAQEGKASGGIRRKHSAIKEPSSQAIHPILTRKARSNAFVHFDVLDVQPKEKPSLGNFLKSFYEQKKSSHQVNKMKKIKKELQTSKESVDLTGKKQDETRILETKKNSLRTTSSNNERERAKEKRVGLVENAPATPVDFLNTFSSKGYGLHEFSEEKERTAHSISLINHDSHIIDNQHLSIESSKGGHGEHHMLSGHLQNNTQGSSENEADIDKLITDIIKSHNMDEIRHNPHAKFLTLRKQVQEKRAARNTRSFDPQRFMQEVESRMGKNPPKVRSRRVASVEREPQVQDKPKSLSSVLKKTKQMLEVYQEREKQWRQEKKGLLKKIKVLELKLVENG